MSGIKKVITAKTIAKSRKGGSLFLDITRARQILDSKEKIDVLYHGSPVWIEGVSSNNMAEVTKLSGLKQRIEVPVNMLEEKLQQQM